MSENNEDSENFQQNDQDDNNQDFDNQNDDENNEDYLAGNQQQQDNDDEGADNFNENNQDEPNQDENPEQQQQNAEEEEEDDDFPEYANEQNKQLNQIIKEKRRLINEISVKHDEKNDRFKILQEHLKNVQAELLHTQALIDAKNQEIESEDHLKQISEGQNNRLQQELKKLEKLGIEQQERLNDLQNQIFKGNEKMDQYKLKMNWNQEELEQWALAARQKEEDNITLEKYKRADEAKIKELNLQIERLTLEVSRKQTELEKEITETQTAQIELDKTAEEFKRHHEDRHQVFLQWQDVSEKIARRDQAFVQEGENFAKIKMEINQNKQLLEDKKILLKQGKLENKNFEVQIVISQRRIVEEQTKIKKIQEDIQNLKADVEIYKNQLSAFALELAQKRQRCVLMSEELLVKKQRLNNAQKKYSSQQQKLKNEELLGVKFMEDKDLAEQQFNENLNEKSELERRIRLQKDNLFKATQELFKLREQEANLYGEIQGTMSACRNLQSHINKLNQEFQRQQELLYNAEYQIQLMQRKVDRAKGVRNFEEKKDLDMQIETLKKQEDDVNGDQKLLTNSVKKLDDEIRAVKRKLTQINSEKQKYISLNDELTLENDMTYQDLNKIIKQKEEEMVRVDVMKLEIKKIQDNLENNIDTVFELENRKYQIEQSMQEREREIQVHKDVLIAEEKAAEDERHKIAVELAERKNKVKNLKIKYESLVQKNKASSGEVDNVTEHSQAYYVIKAAQEKEVLQRKGDELDAKIEKSKKELNALYNTQNHLKSRNSNYRDSFLNKGVTENDFESRDGLEDQCKAASKNLFSKQKDFQKVQKEYEEDMKRSQEIQNKMELIQGQIQNSNQNVQQLQNELTDQEAKIQRAEQQLKSKLNNIKQLKININQNNPHIIQLNYDIEVHKTKTLLTAIYNITTEYPELSNIFEVFMEAKNLKMPSRPQSQIQTASVKSVSSRQSQRSQKL